MERAPGQEDCRALPDSRRRADRPKAERENCAERNSQDWQIVASEIVIDTPHLRLRRDEVELPSGKRIGPYYVRESRGFTIVFAVTAQQRVVLVRQYKHGIGKPMLELPAGGIDSGETAATCARRELAEETGYVGNPAELEPIGTYVFDPTSSTTTYHLYLARDAQPLVPTAFDDTEAIDVELASFDEVRRYVCDGTIELGIHIASIYTALDYLGRLGEPVESLKR